MKLGIRLVGERNRQASTSRGGFMAIQFAAHDRRVGCVAGFAPVTDLEALTEFSAQADDSVVRGLNLSSHADRLAGRPVWILIGDHDERVGTDRAIQLARTLSKAARG